MSGPDFPKGCPGAVFWFGWPSKLFCEGRRVETDGKVDWLYPWWKKCCYWDGNICQPKCKIPFKKW